jgi:hypothetical protein
MQCEGKPVTEPMTIDKLHNIFMKSLYGSAGVRWKEILLYLHPVILM